MSSQNVSERFLKELFIEKRVSVNPQLYQVYYSNLWPCEKWFKEFLSATSSQHRLSIAKKIIHLIGFISNYPVPSLLIDSLIKTEGMADDSEEASVGQDHVTHSVNLYILGIYLFFNLPFFQERILSHFSEMRSYYSKFESPIENRMSSFITAWQTFALFHDVGYSFERKNTISEHEKSTLFHGYSNLNRYIAHHLITKAIARILFANLLFERAKSKFRIEEHEQELTQDHKWYLQGNSGHKKVLPPWEEINNTFKDFVKLEVVKSYKGFAEISPFVDGNEFLFCLRDKTMSIVAICFLDNSNQAKTYFIDSLPFAPSQIRDIAKLGFNKALPEGYYCEYYLSPAVLDRPRRILNKDTAAQNLFLCTKDQFAPLLSFTITEQDFGYVIFQIYNKLIDWLPYSLIDKTGVASLKKNYIDSICANIYKREISKIIDDHQLTPKKHTNGDPVNTIVKDLESALAAKIKRKEFFQSICNKVDNELIHEPRHQIIMLLHELYGIHAKAVSNIPLQLNVTIENSSLRIAGDTLADETISGDISKLVKQYASKLHINFTDLLNYNHGDATAYDHGIISGKFLAYISWLEMQLADLNCVINYAWNVPLGHLKETVFQRNMPIISQVIFSILLHNVWVKSDVTPYGLQYKQSLFIDAFSYFSAFCDNIQIWDRDQLIDLSKSFPRDRFYSSQQFDIFVKDNQICLVCETADVEKFMHRRITSMDEYLEDASKLIRVTVTRTTP